MVFLMRMFEGFHPGEIGFAEPADTQAKKDATHKNDQQDTHNRCNNKSVYIKGYTGFDQSGGIHIPEVQSHVPECCSGIGQRVQVDERKQNPGQGHRRDVGPGQEGEGKGNNRNEQLEITGIL